MFDSMFGELEEISTLKKITVFKSLIKQNTLIKETKRLRSLQKQWRM